MSPIAPPLQVGAPKAPPGGSLFELLIQTRSWSTFGLLIQPRSFLRISLMILIYNKVALEIRLVTCCETFHTSQISASVPNSIFMVMINIQPFGVIFGCYGTLSDDSDSAQVRFLRHPQQEGQRGRCSAKYTKS